VQREASGIAEGKDRRVQGELVLQYCLMCLLQSMNALVHNVSPLCVCVCVFVCLFVLGGGVLPLDPRQHRRLCVN